MQFLKHLQFSMLLHYINWGQTDIGMGLKINLLAY